MAREQIHIRGGSVAGRRIKNEQSTLFYFFCGASLVLLEIPKDFG